MSKILSEKKARKGPRNPKIRPHYSIDNPPKGFVMSVEDLRNLRGAGGKNSTYGLLHQGVYPSIRENGRIMVLTIPTLAILRGEREPGTQPPAWALEIPATKRGPKPKIKRDAKKHQVASDTAA